MIERPLPGSEDVALGVVTYDRHEKLDRLLASARGHVDTVYIADNGPTMDAKADVYDRNDTDDIDLQVLYLEENAGVGACRDCIAQELDEDYLLMADDDHELGHRTGLLLAQLRARPDVGGIAPSIIEPDAGRIWQSAKDFCHRPEDGLVIRSANLERKTIEKEMGPFVRFDFIPYPTLYRSECLADYSWDPEYPLGRTHMDFYWGHYQTTDWEFGITPAVHAYHYPGGSDAYEAERRDTAKLDYAEEYFRSKWGVAVSGRKQYWYDSAGV